MLQLLKSSFRFFDKYAVLIVFLLLFLVSLLVSLSMNGPVIPTDEAYYINYARCLSGIEKNCVLHGAPYGVALLYFPFMWIDDPFVLYKVLLSLNTLFSSLVFVFVYLILKNLEKFGRLENILISLIVSLYPQVFMSGNLIMTEASFILNSVCVVYLLIRALSLSYVSGKFESLYYFMFGFFAAFDFLIRGNGIVLLLFSILTLVFVYLKYRYKNVFWGFIGIFLLLVLHVFIKLKYFSLADSYVLSVGENVFSKSRSFVEFFRFLGGHLFYNFLSTFLISYFAILYFLKNLYAAFSKKLDHKKLVLFFMLFVFFFNFLLLIFLTIKEGQSSRMDLYFYGRYVEGFIPFVLIPGFVYLFSIKKFKRVFLNLIYILVFLFVLTFYYSFLEGLFLNEFSVLNFVVLGEFFGEISFVKIFLFCLPLILLLYFLLKFSKKLFLLFFVVFYLLLNIFIFKIYYLPALNSVDEYINYLTMIYDNELEIPKVYFDANTQGRYSYHLYNYFVPDFKRFKVSDENFACDNFVDGIVFSSKSDFVVFCPDAKLIIYENHDDLAAYTLSDEIYTELKDRNLVFENVPNQLTDFFMQIELLDEGKRWGDNYLDLRVYNTSSQPWINWWGLQHTDYTNPVRLGMQWLSDDGSVVREERKELLRTVFPGEFVDFEIEIDEPFSKKLRISMVQDGVKWFYDVDSSQKIEIDFD